MRGCSRLPSASRACLLPSSTRSLSTCATRCGRQRRRARRAADRGTTAGGDLRIESNPRYPDAPPVPYTELVNPVLTPLDDATEEGWEGCLSVPGLRGIVPRFRRLRYEGLDPSGAPIRREVEGFHARVVQHECDHLDGILYPMRMQDFTRFGFTTSCSRS